MVLIHRHKSWVAELKVPTDVQSFVGKTVLRRTLGEEKTLSKIKHDLAIAEWKLQFENYRGNYTPEVKPEILVKDKTEIIDYIDGWVRQREVAPKTLDTDRQKVTKIVQSIKTIDRITYKNLRITFENMASKGYQHKTLKSYLAAFNDFHKYLRRTDKVTDLLPTDILVRKKSGKKRMPFDLYEIIQIRNEAEKIPDKRLFVLIKLAMYTGCRIEELCSLHCSRVSHDRFEVVNGKTRASNRVIPIHSKIKPLIQKLKRKSNDGYIISGFEKNKYGNRSNVLGKRFGKLKSRLFYDNSKVFHSFRMSVATQLEQAGVPEGVAADILGHDKPTMSYGLYSGGSSFQQKKSAIEEINYG